MNDEQRPPNLNSLEPPLQAAVNAVLAASTPEDAIERVKVRAKELAATIVSPSLASGSQGRVWRASRPHCGSDRRGCGFGRRFVPGVLPGRLRPARQGNAGAGRRLDVLRPARKARSISSGQCGMPTASCSKARRSNMVQGSKRVISC